MNDSIGTVALDKLKPEHIEQMHRDLSKHLSPATVLKAHRVLSRALKVAEQRGRIARNPARLVDAPKLPHYEATPLTVDDAKAVLQAARGRRNAPRWTVALALGLRQGEALGLRWDDVDLDVGTLTVRHTLQRSVDGSGPCWASRRPAAPAAPSSCPHPCRRRCASTERPRPASASSRASQWIGDPLEHFVFASHRGQHISHRADADEWARSLKQAGVPKARLHDAQHTAATLMLIQGVPPRVVMEILGHPTIQMTMNTYSHVVPELAESATAATDEALAQNHRTNAKNRSRHRIPLR